MNTILNKNFSFTVLFAAFLASCFSAKAQEIQLQSITKTVEKTFPFKSGFEVNIEGEKAEVDIRTWEKDVVTVQLELVAKHPEVKVAVEDLEKMEFSLDQIGKQIVLKNNIQEDQKETVTSSVKAIYKVFLPADCPVVLSNYFGKAHIQDLTNSIVLKSEFTSINMTNVTGAIGVNTRFGDIIGESLEGEVDIDAHRSDITLSRLGGKFNIDAKYSSIKIYADQSYIDLNINAEKSDVQFYDSSLSAYNYALQTQNGKITVPSIMDFDFEEENSQVKRASFRPSEEMSGVRVAINVSFGEIRIGD